MTNSNDLEYIPLIENIYKLEECDNRNAISKINSFCLNEETEKNSCEFYKKCLDFHFNCDVDTGYPLAFAYNYCNSYSKYVKNYSESIQKWVNEVKICLKKSLKNFYENSINNNTYDCESLKKHAFESHPECYVKSGLCEVFSDNTYELIQLLDDVFINFESLQKIKTDTMLWLKQIKETFLKCFDKLSSEKINSILQNIDSIYESGKGFLDDKVKKIINFLKRLFD